MKKLLNFKNNNSGFTLIEALVSIAIVLIAVMAPLTLIMNSITNISQNKNRIVASYLAEEVVEDIRAYRDGLTLACSDIYIPPTFYTTGDISGATCNRNSVGIPIPVNYLKDSDGNPNYSNQTVAWNLFLDNLTNVINKDVYLDKNSFNFTTFNTLVSYTKCNLGVNTLIGYFCNPGSSEGQYERTIVLTPIAGNILKVEVTVIYAKSHLFGVPDKSLKVTDYIYER